MNRDISTNNAEIGTVSLYLPVPYRGGNPSWNGTDNTKLSEPNLIYQNQSAEPVLGSAFSILPEVPVNNAPIIIDQFIGSDMLGYSRDMALAYWRDRVVIDGKAVAIYVTTNDHGDEVARSNERPEIDIPSEAA